MVDEHRGNALPPEVAERYATALSMPNPTGGTVSGETLDPYDRQNRFNAPAKNSGVEGHDRRDERNRANAERNLVLQRQYEAEATITEARLTTYYPEDNTQLSAADRERYALDSQDENMRAGGLASYTQARAVQMRHLVDQRAMARVHGELAEFYTQMALRNETSWNREWSE